MDNFELPTYFLLTYYFYFLFNTDTTQFLLVSSKLFAGFVWGQHGITVAGKELPDMWGKTVCHLPYEEGTLRQAEVSAGLMCY